VFTLADKSWTRGQLSLLLLQSEVQSARRGCAVCAIGGSLGYDKYGCELRRGLADVPEVVSAAAFGPGVAGLVGGRLAVLVVPLNSS
jgi:hypothetical protein